MLTEIDTIEYYDAAEGQHWFLLSKYKLKGIQEKENKWLIILVEGTIPITIASMLHYEVQECN